MITIYDCKSFIFKNIKSLKIFYLRYIFSKVESNRICRHVCLKRKIRHLLISFCTKKIYLLVINTKDLQLHVCRIHITLLGHHNTRPKRHWYHYRTGRLPATAAHRWTPGSRAPSLQCCFYASHYVCVAIEMACYLAHLSITHNEPLYTFHSSN